MTLCEFVRSSRYGAPIWIEASKQDSNAFPASCLTMTYFLRADIHRCAGNRIIVAEIGVSRTTNAGSKSPISFYSESLDADQNR